MTKAKIRPHIGQSCLVRWRNPQSEDGWSDDPLSVTSATVETLCWPQGFNPLGELVVAASRAGKDRGDRTAIPCALVYEIVPVKVAARGRG